MVIAQRKAICHDFGVRLWLAKRYGPKVCNESLLMTDINESVKPAIIQVFDAMKSIYQYIWLAEKDCYEEQL